MTEAAPSVMEPWQDFVRSWGFHLYPSDEKWLAETRSEYEQIRQSQISNLSAWLYFDLYQQETGEYLEYACGRALT